MPSSSSATTSPSTIACLALIQVGCGAGQVREVARGILLVARPEANLAVVDDGLDAVAVELHLEEPVRVVERLVRRRGLHRLDEVGQWRLARAGQVDVRLLCRRVAVPDGVAAGFDLVVGAAGLDRVRMRRRRPTSGSASSSFLWMSSQLSSADWKPRVLTMREAALELLAVEAELELALADGLARIVRLLRLERAPVPDDHVAAAVLALGDDALEVEVGEGMVLDVDGHAPVGWIEAGPFGHGPRHQHAVDLEAEVVVQPRRAMALDDEAPPFRRRLDRAHLARRLGRLGEVALAVVRLERQSVGQVRAAR